jgi:hypothetical protein
MFKKIFFAISLGLIALPAYAIQITNPLKTDDPQVLIGLIIKSALGLVGSIALIFFIIGGFTWMTAQGKSDQVKKGRETLVWATIGLIVIFSAYAILSFFFTKIVPAQ